jgi:cytochrome P450
MTTSSSSVSGEVAGGIARTIAGWTHHDPLQAEVSARHRVLDTLHQGKCPLGPSEQHGGFWVASHYDDVQAVTLDTARFSSRYTSVPKEAFGGDGFPPLPPINLDPPAHTHFRKLMLPSFSPRTIAKWEESVRANARALLDGFAHRGRCDAAAEYARRIPIQLMATMLGVPPRDEDLFTSWIKRLVQDGGIDPQDALVAAGELGEYLRARIEHSRATPGDDLLTLFIQSEVDGDRIDDDGLLGAAVLIVVAGIDTTWSAIGSALYQLATQPDDRRRLLQEPGVWGTAIEELLRFYSPAVVAGRIVTGDTTHQDTDLAKGDTMMLCWPAANRDEKQFPEAHRFVIDRQVNRHFAFGLGPHRCMGSNVARMELRVSLQEWLHRIPDFGLDGDGDIEWATGPIWGPRRLALSWS